MEQVSRLSPWQALDNNWVNVSAVSCRWDAPRTTLAQYQRALDVFKQSISFGFCGAANEDHFKNRKHAEWIDGTPLIDPKVYGKDRPDYRFDVGHLGAEYENRIIMRGARIALVRKYSINGRSNSEVGWAIKVCARFAKRALRKSACHLLDQDDGVSMARSHIYPNGLPQYIIPRSVNDTLLEHATIGALRELAKSRFEGHWRSWDASFTWQNLMREMNIPVHNFPPKGPNALINGKFYYVRQKNMTFLRKWRFLCKEIEREIEHENYRDGLGTP